MKDIGSMRHKPLTWWQRQQLKKELEKALRSGKPIDTRRIKETKPIILC